MDLSLSIVAIGAITCFVSAIAVRITRPKRFERKSLASYAAIFINMGSLTVVAGAVIWIFIR